MQNSLTDDIKTLLGTYLNTDLTLKEDEWKKQTFTGNKLDEKKVEEFSKILYEEYVTRIKVTRLFNEPNVETIKPYQLKYNVRRFWFKDEDSGFAIEPNEIVASQEGVKIILKEGEYINGGELESFKPLSDSPEFKKSIKEFIYVYLPRKVFKQKNNFYIYTYGDFLLRNYYEPIVRFYFSLEPEREKIQQFTDKIKDFFNERRIPFNFKTPLKLENFGRGDTLVLYVAQNHFFYVREFINELRNFANRKEILRTNIPLFVKKIYEGVGFAEDPFFVDDSFGMQRVKLIINVINNLLSLNKKVSIVNILESIELEGYNLDEFYRNPYTNFQYNFESFDAPISLNPQYAFKVGRVYFGEYNQLALEYALDLVGKAIWNDKNELTWFTYDKDDSYRLLSENEVIDIYWFLHKVIQIKENRNYFTNAVLKIIDDKIIDNEHKPNYKDRIKILQKGLTLSIDTLKNLSFDDFEKNYDKLFNDAKKWSNIENISKFKEQQKSTFSNLTFNIKSSFQSIFQAIPKKPLPQSGDIFGGKIRDFNKEEILKKANSIYHYAKMDYPIPNSSGNYEYCPTDEGRLRIASIMLHVYCPSLFEDEA